MRESGGRAPSGRVKTTTTHVWIVEQSIGADVRDGKKVHLHAGRADERESRAHGAGHGEEEAGHVSKLFSFTVTSVFLRKK